MKHTGQCLGAHKMAYKPLSTLEGRFLELLQALADGETLKEYVYRSPIAYNTATERLDAIRDFLGAKNRYQAIAEGFRKGYLK